jgi:hypothetical protein
MVLRGRIGTGRRSGLSASTGCNQIWNSVSNDLIRFPFPKNAARKFGWLESLNESKSDHGKADSADR